MNLLFSILLTFGLLLVVALGFKYGDALLISHYARNASTFGR